MKALGQLQAIDKASNFPANVSADDAVALLQDVYQQLLLHVLGLATEANTRMRTKIQGATHRDLMRGIKTCVESLPEIERLLASLQGRSDMSALERLEQAQKALDAAKDEMLRREQRPAIDITPEDNDGDNDEQEMATDAEAEASAGESADDGGERPEAPRDANGRGPDSR